MWNGRIVQRFMVFLLVATVSSLAAARQQATPASTDVSNNGAVNATAPAAGAAAPAATPATAPGAAVVAPQQTPDGGTATPAAGAATPASTDMPSAGSQTSTDATPAAASPAAAGAPQGATVPGGTGVDAVIDKILAQEKVNGEAMKQYRPLIETYMQELKPDSEINAVLSADHYFLGKVDMSGGLGEKIFRKQKWSKTALTKRLYEAEFHAAGFVNMMFPDYGSFDRKHYSFRYLRREFLSDIRCMVFEVSPTPDAGDNRFHGRIWVDDQDYNIVRFNGVYGKAMFSKLSVEFFVHFDSWRANVREGVWLPVYIYSEESNLKPGLLAKNVHFKGLSRIWGYSKPTDSQQEFTDVVVDTTNGAQDSSESARDASPIEAQRLWERQNENNVIDRLERAGLIAPRGDVDKLLLTVVNNLEITNNLEIAPEVRCRVLLTSPLESFTVGHTIVISRGLLDVLPNEASLAMVLAHELAHIALGHQLPPKYAFSDRVLFDDENSFLQVNLQRDGAQEDAADQKGIELLNKSPYRDKLPAAGLFLRALRNNAGALPNLLKARVGNSIYGAKAPRMESLIETSPELEVKKLDQIAALPLGARVKLNAWDESITLIKGNSVAILSASEKMYFEVTPVFPHLQRFVVAGKAASAAPPAVTTPVAAPTPK